MSEAKKDESGLSALLAADGREELAVATGAAKLLANYIDEHMPGECYYCLRDDLEDFIRSYGS
jgi:hypothetical protein